MNRVILLGRLGLDPELGRMPGGESRATLSLATSTEPRVGAAVSPGRTEWHRVVLLGHLAESARSTVAKGSLVYVEGRLQTRKWTDTNGKARRMTEVVATVMRIFDCAAEQRKPESPPIGTKPNAAARKPIHIMWQEIQRDIPF